MSELVLVAATSVSASLDEQIERASRRREQAHSAKTRERYELPWKRFCSWCHVHDADAAHPQIVATYLNSLFEAGTKLSSIEIARAAILYGHTRDGLQFDSRDQDLRRVMSAIRRGSRKHQKSVAALEAADLRNILASDAADVQSVRDRALIALGFGHALRGPSELLQLDYSKLGDGNGWIELTSAGVTIKLESSKTSQEAAETLICSSASVRQHVAAWIVAGKIAPGTPLFRRLRKGGTVTGSRLTDDGMTQAIRRSVVRLMRSRGMSEAEAAAISRKFNTHSLRRGCATSLAKKGLDAVGLQKVTRHKSLTQLQKYIDLGGQATKPVADLLD